MLSLFLVCACLADYAGQTTSELIKDTMSLPDGKNYAGEYMEAILKDNSTVRIFKTSDNRYFLRFIVARNFYFDKVDMLEIRSGKMSYYEKDVRQYKVSKTAGLFFLEIFRNYLGTLSEYGITSIVFGEAETAFTRQDAIQVKKIAKHFYEIEAASKN